MGKNNCAEQIPISPCLAIAKDIVVIDHRTKSLAIRMQQTNCLSNTSATPWSARIQKDLKNQPLPVNDLSGLSDA